MLSLNIFLITSAFLLAASGSLAATVAPPPLIQTLGATNVGPEFEVVGGKNATRNDSRSADDGIKTKKQGIEDADFWYQVATNQLRKIIKAAQKSKDTAYRKKAKNIIIFIGDGMGLTTITAGRIYKGQQSQQGNGEEAVLSFDGFPNTGLAKTYNVDMQVPDSAATATAIFSGSKTHYGAIGMDITRSKTDAAQGRLRSLMDWAQAENKRTGIVTTTRITHATPAATYARIYHRDWECDGMVPAESVGKHVDIARQLVENAPGNRFNVILGGGLSPMGARNENEKRSTPFEGPTEKICSRSDGRNLAQEWLAKAGVNDSRVFVRTREQLLNINFKRVDHLMGLFRNNHITYSVAREEGEPSLKEMTEAAIEVLERGSNSKGYVLMVEGGRIDQAHHQNYARAAMQEVIELDMAIEAALKATDASETLIIVTADHSHSVTLNGYPKRGGDILGFAGRSNDLMTYETITYANGPGYWDHLANGSRGHDSSIFWRPLEQLSEEQRLSSTYRHLAALPLKDESHGGEDVIVFANGPGSTLVRGVFEQNYLAYMMSYAGCMGPVKELDETCAAGFKSAAGSISIHVFSLILLIFVHVPNDLFI